MVIATRKQAKKHLLFKVYISQGLIGFALSANAQQNYTAAVQNSGDHKEDGMYLEVNFSCRCAIT